jgi:hypothetical protein
LQTIAAVPGHGGVIYNASWGAIGCAKPATIKCVAARQQCACILGFRCLTRAASARDWPRPQDFYTSFAEANAQLETVTKSKLKKGYVIISDGTEDDTQALPRALLAVENRPPPKPKADKEKKRAAPAAEQQEQREAPPAKKAKAAPAPKAEKAAAPPKPAAPPEPKAAPAPKAAPKVKAEKAAVKAEAAAPKAKAAPKKAAAPKKKKVATPATRAMPARKGRA